MSLKTPLVTIVIIVFNDADRISIAIESARRQTLDAIEILVVDHGSTDGTADVARRYEQDDERVRLVQLPDNQGEPGRPLNAGLDAARGQWVTVMGSDDEIEDDACRYMLSFADLRDVDVVLGKVSRVHAEDGNRITYWHNRLFREEQLIASIEEAPDYLSDTISAGKLYRKEFLDENAIRFPEDIIYEDQLFTLQVYHRARGIQVLSRSVYKWYSRPNAASRSITNSRGQIKNFEDRIEVNRRIDNYLSTVDSPVLHTYKSEKFIGHDLNIYLNNLEEQNSEYRSKFGELSKEYLSAIRLDHELNVHPLLKTIVGLLKIGDVDGAVAAHRFRQGRGPQPVELHECDGRQYWLDNTVIAESGLDREWFDVTTLGIHLMPFSRRRLGIDSRNLTLDGPILFLDCRIIDKGYSLKSGVESVTLLLRRRRDKHEVDFPLSWDVETPTTLRAHGAVDLAVNFDGEVKFHENWDLWIRVFRRGVPKMLRVPWPRGFVAGASVALAGRHSLAGNEFVSFKTDRGNLSFRVEQSHRAAKAIAWRLARSRRVMNSMRNSVLRPLGLVSNSKIGKSTTTAARSLAGDVAVRRSIERKSVFFESYRGRQYSDSPRAISEELHRRHPDIRQYWSYRNDSLLDEFPDYVYPVRFDSVHYHSVVSRVEIWVDNFGIDPKVRKHPDNTYVQTWHGVPLKRLFFDSPRLIAANSAAQANYRNAISRWDYVVSQGEYFEKTFVRSANPRGELIRSGSPRTDLLFAANETNRDLIRQRLGLPLNRRIALYMPTYRKRRETSPKYASLDFRLLSEQLLEDWFVLSRQHYYRKGSRFPHDLAAFVKDVSRYPSAEELMAVADVLITDFSSAMFDFSVLSKPIVFYTPDLEDYETVSPRTYVGLKDIAPGPICRDESQLAQAIREVEADPKGFEEQVADFRRRFMPLEDGNSSARIIEKLWPETQSTRPTQR